MARRKYKLTGFARFFLVMLFLAPAAYFAATYINGDEQNPIKEWIEQITQPGEEKVAPENPATTADPKTLEAINQQLRDSLRTKELEIRELERQIRLLEGSSQ